MRQLGLYLMVVVSVVGCLKTRAELRAENYEPQPQRQTLLAQRDARPSRGQTQQAQPAYHPTQEDIDEQMRNLSGRIDVVENQMNQISAGQNGDKDSASKERQQTEQKFLAYEEALKKLEMQVHALTEEVTKMKLAMERPAPSEKPAAKGKEKEKAEEKNPRAAYDDGEALFNQKKFKEAILSYQKYRDNHPKGKMYADATYKMGVCFQEAGLKDEAKVFFEEVINKFSGSKEAKKAAFRLKQIK